MAYTMLKNTDYEYQILPDGTIELLNYIGPKRKHIIIPAIIDGKPVTVIGKGLFYFRTPWSIAMSIKSVAIPAMINTIKPYAFYMCSNLRKIKTPDYPQRSRKIGKNAFAGTAYYNNPDNWHDGILYIDYGRCIIAAKEDFYKNYKSDEDGIFLLPLKVDCVAEGAFKGTKGFEEVYGTNVAVNAYAFAETDVRHLCLINCDVHATAFEETPFMSNEENWHNSCIYVYNQLLACRAKKGTQCRIAPETVAVSDGAFDGCGADVTVTLPISVKKIGLSKYPDNFLFYCEH